MPFTLFKPHTWDIADTGNKGTPWVLPIGGQGQSWEVTISGQAGTATIVARLWNNATDAYGEYYVVAALDDTSDTVTVVCAADVEYSVQFTLANEVIAWEVTPKTASIPNSSTSDRVWYPIGRDRQAIQDALDAAEAAGGGIVQLAYGTYNILTVNSPASGDKAGGAYGLEIPSNVSLVGSGPGTVLSIVAGGAFGVGTGISPKGMRTATANFGAASNVRLADFSIGAATQEESNGNLINLVHASDWIIERVNITGSYFHGIEIDQSRRITVTDCRFSGSYSGGTSGSWIQLDRGLAGPVNRPAGITTNSVEDITFIRCYGAARPSTDTGDRDIDINHTPNLTVTRVAFIDCLFEGRARTGVSIAGIDDNAAIIDSLRFQSCKFVTNHYGSEAFRFTNTNATVRKLIFRDCTFSGPSAIFLRAGGSTSTTYAATHSQRHSISVEGCSFLFDKTQMPVSWDIRLLSVTAWMQATLRGNYIRAFGDFPVSVGTIYSYGIVCVNNLALQCCDNTLIWEGNATFSVSRVGLSVLSNEADAASLTLGEVVTGNTVYATGATGFSYGIVKNGGAPTARRGFVWSGNFSNAANTPENGVLVLGTTTAGNPSGGGLALAQRTVTANTTITQQDGVIDCDTAAGSITVTVPNVLFRKFTILFKTSGSNSLICGSTTVTANGAAIVVYSDGTTTFTRGLAPSP